MIKKYGVPARIGERFDKEVEDIKIARTASRKSKEKPSTETISNLIARHKKFKEIKEDIIKLEEDVFNEK